MLGNIKGGNNKFGVANVSSNNALQVVTPQDQPQAGFVQICTRFDGGTAMGGVPTHIMPELSDDYRLLGGFDQSLINLTFEGTAFPYHQITIPSATTQTVTMGTTGSLVLNSGATTTTTTSCYARTIRHVPTFGTFPSYLDIWMQETNATSSNCITEWGLLYLTSSGTQTPLDGVFFRRISGGSLQAVANYGGTETVLSINTTNVPSRITNAAYSPSETNHYVIVYHNDELKYWINDTLVASIKCPASQATFTSSSNTPIGFRVFNSGAVSPARQLYVKSINFTLGDIQSCKPWSHSMCGSGQGAYQTQMGHPNGITQTANWNNSAAPASVVGSNTDSMYNALGGQWSEAATQLNETDIPIFGYQIPAGTTATVGKSLYITGIRIGETVVTANAVGASGAQFWWAAAVGGSTASLAGTDTAGPPSTSAPRRVALGCQSFVAGAAVGTYSPGIFVDLKESPLVATPGTYAQIIRKQTNGNTSSAPVWRGTATVIGYWE